MMQPLLELRADGALYLTSSPQLLHLLAAEECAMLQSGALLVAHSLDRAAGLDGGEEIHKKYMENAHEDSGGCLIASLSRLLLFIHHCDKLFGADDSSGVAINHNVPASDAVF
jgi:hypothetical protein